MHQLQVFASKMYKTENHRCDSGWKGETQLQRLLGSLAPLVGVPTLRDYHVSIGEGVHVI